MKKNTMYLIGGLAVLGVGYYILNKKIIKIVQLKIIVTQVE